MTGGWVGAATPAGPSSTVTAITWYRRRSRFTTTVLLPSASGWRTVTASGAPEAGINQISYTFPGGAAGSRLKVTRATDCSRKSTTVAWGGSSVAELSKEIEGVVKKHEKKMKVKIAVADGQEVAFDLALKMPTKAEALGRVVMLALAPARRVAGQIVGPASQVCGQIKGIKDMKKDEAPAAETPPTA